MQPTAPPGLQNKHAALAALAAAKREMGNPRRLIGQMRRGRLDAGDLHTVLLRRIHRGFARLDEGGRGALEALLLHLERRSDLLSTAWGSTRLGRRPGNTLIDGLIALTHWHGHWVRPPRTWRPPRGGETAQFASLTRHLLARYDVPAFMDLVWFRGGGAEARRQQSWFVHIGGGANIRTADVPLRLTKRMAHQFLQAPDDCTVEAALRWAQILGQGGDPELVDAVNATRLGRSFEDEDFWGSVVHYLVRHPHLDRALVRPIVDYIHYRRFVPREAIGPGGQIAQEGPPEPHFSMKSRSLPKLLRQVTRWQALWTEGEPAPDATFDLRRRRSAYFYCQDEDEATGRVLEWSVQELTTARALANEGEAMSHCAASYSSKLGKLSLWSVQVLEEGRTRRVMTVAVDNEQRLVTQARGRYNANPERQIALPDEEWDGDRDRGWLSAADRYYLRRSYRILQMWLEKEELEYAPSGR